MKKFAYGLAAALACATAMPASAAYVVNISQVGANVVATGSGSISLAGLGNPGSGGGVNNVPSSMYPYFAEFTIGSGANKTWSTTTLTGPASFGGIKLYKPADSMTGALVGVNAHPSLISSTHFIITPYDYVSGADLGTSTATYLNTTLDTFGMAAGNSYTWTWGDGKTTDTFTINILAAAVPEPATWAMMIMGFGMVGATMRRRNKPAARLA